MSFGVRLGLRCARRTPSKVSISPVDERALVVGFQKLLLHEANLQRAIRAPATRKLCEKEDESAQHLELV